MSATVFYAWQSDIERRHNQYFIRDALTKALKDVRSGASLSESPRLDHDTEGVTGTPDIFATILDKITGCAVFVADVTPVASTSRGKQVPNPNVLLELGYALARVGDRRILLVMNSAFGSPEDLQFDLARRRWPIMYSLTHGGDIKVTAKSLRDSLRTYLQLIFDAESVANPEQLARERCAPVRRASIVQAVRTFAAVFNGMNHVMRRGFESSHLTPSDTSRVFLETIGRQIERLHDSVNTNGLALQPDLLPDLLVLLNSSIEAHKRLCFFAQVFQPGKAAEDFIGDPPFEQLEEIERVITRIRSVYPDVFLDRAIIGTDLLSAEQLKAVWARTADVLGCFYWQPEQFVFSGRVPNVMNHDHLRRLGIAPPPSNVHVFSDY